MHLFYRQQDNVIQNSPIWDNQYDTGREQLLKDLLILNLFSQQHSMTAFVKGTNIAIDNSRKMKEVEAIE